MMPAVNVTMATVEYRSALDEGGVHVPTHILGSAEE